MFGGAGGVRGRGRCSWARACPRSGPRVHEQRRSAAKAAPTDRLTFVGAGLPALDAEESSVALHRSHLLRKGRFSESGRAYLVSTVTQGRDRLFADWRVGREVAHALVDSPVDTLAWVLMPDHLHWLLQLHDATLGDVVGSMKSRSARAVNARLARKGSVWQKGFHDHAVRAEEDLRALARYVVANPLRAGLVRQIGDYPLWDAHWL